MARAAVTHAIPVEFTIAFIRFCSLSCRRHSTSVTVTATAAPGGHQVFFGPLGHHARNLVDYFHSMPWLPRLPAGHNPATYMLDVTSDVAALWPAGTSNVADAFAVYKRQETVALGTAQLADAAPPPTTPVLLAAMEVEVSSLALATAPATAVTVASAVAPAVTVATAVNSAATADVTASADIAVPVAAIAPEAGGPGVSQHLAAEPERTKMTGADFGTIYAGSGLAAENNASLAGLHEPGGQTAVPASPGMQHGHHLDALPTTLVTLEPLSYSGSHAAGAGLQASAVLGRALRDSWRNAEYSGSRLVAIAFLALFFGLLYSDLDYGTFQGVQSGMGAILAVSNAHARVALIRTRSQKEVQIGIST